MSSEEKIQKLVEKAAYNIYLYRLSICDETTQDMWETFTDNLKRPWITVAKQLLSHPDLALIDREKERPKFYPRGTTGVNPILPVQVNIPKVIKDLYDSYQPVIPIAKALKEIEDGH